MRRDVPALLVMTRLFDAPRAQVFDTWSRPDRLARWWDPDGPPAACLLPYADGGYRVLPRGRVVAIRELVRPERILFTWGGQLEETRTLIAITLVEEAGRTRLVLEQSLAAPQRRVA